jgi:tyrosinase
MAVGIRRSLTDIQADYDAGNTAELETLMRAWKGIKELDASDPNSFFKIGGFHGEPFRGPGETDGAWWGGYCQHGTVLFPTWHRAYLWRLELALQSIPGCENVRLPFWDECSGDSRTNGIPRALTDELFELDGVEIDNPLRSFKLPIPIVDQVAQDNVPTDLNRPNYSKNADYETVRYPLSGLVGTPAYRQATAAHNANFPNYADNVNFLNDNIIAWLNTEVTTGGKTRGLVYDAFVSCLDAPNYTVFSNTTSQKRWTATHPGSTLKSLEYPHNYIHLAVGGFDIPAYDASPIDGANGDMGENDTAGLDPIFYFHHCFIDYVFWIWQRRHGATYGFTIDVNDPGAAYIANINANNQPPADAVLGAPLTMNTALDPFTYDDGSDMPMVSNDVVHIEEQLGYTYGPGSLDAFAIGVGAAEAEMVAAEPEAMERTIHVGGLDRSKIAGSFLIVAYAETDGGQELVGIEPVLSRWNVGGCANCQTRLKTTADFPIAADLVESGAVKVLVHTRQGVLGDAPRALESAGLVLGGPRRHDTPFTVEIR